MNAPTLPGDLNPAEAAPAMGHNNPPAFDSCIVDGFEDRVTCFLEATQAWLNIEEIKDEHQAGLITDQIDGLRGLFKEVDAARKEAKSPHDAAAKEVQAAFTPLLEKLKASAESLKPKLAAYATKKAAEEAIRLREMEAASEQRRKDAEARAKLAEFSGDISAQVDAQKEAKLAAKAAKQAAKGPDTTVKSATGAGKTMSLKTLKMVEITNINILFMALKDEPKVAELLTSIATAKVRAKGYDHAKAPLPGIKIHEVKQVA